MNQISAKTQKRTRRHGRIRARVSGTTARPRLAVFRSNRALYAQLIDDEQAVTLAAADSRRERGATARDRATRLGVALAAKAKARGITTVVFDRGGFQYQGAIAAFADSARTAGLIF